jgi:hypothetical protein
VNRQRFWVVFLSLFALAIFMPAATLGWQTRGTYGMRILRAENLVRDVTPGSVADLAGIAPGDRIDVSALGIRGHLALMYPRPGNVLTVTVVSGKERRDVTLRATAGTDPPMLRWLILGEFLSTAAFIFVGALLVFLRPVPMTWWLWLYCIGIVPVNELLDFYSFLSSDGRVAAWLVGRVFLGGFSAFPLMPFVLRFPDDRLSGWRVAWRLPLIALTLVLLVYYCAISWYGLHDGLDNYSWLNGGPALFIYFISATLLLLTFVRSHGEERQRLKWVFSGMLIGFIAEVLVYIPGPDWLSPLAGIVSIVMPISVAYAALRQRLIDVDFVINRAIVYTAMTALLIAFVSLLDFLTSRFISEYHLALYLEAGATVAVGFALDRFRGELDRFTDRLFFKERHEAESQLDRVARSLEFVTREDSIDEALVDEPARWLKLASAALFKVDTESGTFERTYSVGWSEADLGKVLDDAPLPRYLRTERRVLAAKEVAWNDAQLPKGAAAPALYLPIFCREALEGFVVYGAHTDTTTLDPDEVTILAGLGPRAGLAFDHLSFEVMRQQLAAATERANLNEKLLQAAQERSREPA